MKSLSRQKYLNLIVLLSIAILLIVVITLFNPKFIKPTNTNAVLVRTCENIIIAVGMTLVIITGNIDLSVGSVLALVPCAMGIFYAMGVPFVWCIFIGFAFGLVVGAINSYLIASAKVPAFIATLATMTGIRSVVYVISDASTISTYPENLGKLSSGSILGVQYPVIIMILVAVFFWLLLNKTKYGRFIYAVGGNKTAAFASGIKVARIQVSVMMISAFCASLAGFLFTARTTTIGPNAGGQSALNSITAVLIGGASINGGTGKLSQTLIGVVIMALINNGLNLLRISSYYQLIITGMVLIAIVGAENIRQARKLEKVKKVKA